jgi:hypothetical protein
MTCTTCGHSGFVEVPCGDPDHLPSVDYCDTCDGRGSVPKPCPDCDNQKPSETFESILNRRMLHCWEQSLSAEELSYSFKYKQRYIELNRLRQILVLHKSRGGDL